MDRRRWIGVALVAALAALGACETRSSHRSADASAASVAAPPSASAPRAPRASASTSAPAPQATVAPAASTAPIKRPTPLGDPCHLTRGPIQLTFTGPATLITGEGDGDPRVVFNRDGVPQAVVLPRGAKQAAPAGKPGKAGDAKATKPERLALTDPAERASAPACVAAGASLFCVDKAGDVHRSALGGEGPAVVAKARPGSPIAAASFAGGHVAYAFLADRKTSEGATTLAFVGIDDATPMLLSEDGCGAISVALASRGENVLAMYVDARRVLTPVHARVLTAPAGKLGLGPDAVVFVGGGTDGHTAGALACGSDGNELALLALDKDDKDFGMAAIRVEEQPRDDSTVTWSLYPAAMDRPVVAATQGVWPIRALRARPAEADPKGKKVLELGEVDAAGVFKALCLVAEGTESASYGDLAMAVDGAGALWLAYTDREGTWLEKRGR